MSKPLSLYNIADEMVSLMETIQNNGGEMGDLEVEALDQLRTLIQGKTDSVVGFYTQLEDEIKAAKERANEIQRFIEVRKNAQERLKSFVGDCLDRMGTKKFQGEFYEIAEKMPSKVLFVDKSADVPPEFITVETVVKVDKVGLKQAVKDGLKVDGVSLRNGKRSIQFKTKTLSKGKKK